MPNALDNLLDAYEAMAHAHPRALYCPKAAAAAKRASEAYDAMLDVLKRVLAGEDLCGSGDLMGAVSAAVEKAGNAAMPSSNVWLVRFKGGGYNTVLAGTLNKAKAVAKAEYGYLDIVSVAKPRPGEEEALDAEWSSRLR